MRALSSTESALQGILQLVDQFARDRREIVDEIERVLDLVRDAGGELAERGELLRLHQAILGGAQILKRRGQFARARLDLVEQPHVLDRDDSLVGECRDQLDLLVGERARFPALQREHPDDRSFPRQRHTQPAAHVGDTGVIAKAALVEIRIGQQVRNMNCTLFKNCAPEDRSSIGPRRIPCKEIALVCGESKGRSERINIALAAPDDPGVRLANAGCGFDERIEHGLQVEGRAADDLEHVRGRRLLL